MSKRQLQVYLSIVFVAMAAIGIILPLIHYYRICRNGVGVAQCHGNLSAIGVGLLSYHDKYGAFPPSITRDASGNPMHSWRALLLEFTDQNLAQDYDLSQPWNSQSNLRLTHRMPSFFACPNSRNRKESGITSYVAVVGRNTLLRDHDFVSYSMVRRPLRDVAIIIESDNLGILWLEPRDVSIDELASNEQPTALSSQDREGAAVLFANASHRRLKPGEHFAKEWFENEPK